MSVKVAALTKNYAGQTALDGISFEARPGEVLGFLGPNGAGKTTTMKILTGYIAPDAGSAMVCGLDVASHPFEVRTHLGYLPEHNPLYKDMYVREFLLFCARVHRLASPSKRIEEVIELTGLGREAHKLIGALSKGYRQRVGLAQALLHDPDVLILDEPTTGLDPNQLVEIRQLIRTLGQSKTLIFSTHIMQEVQAVCDRVLIIHQGQIVADDPVEKLTLRLQGEQVVTAAWQSPVSPDALGKIKDIRRIQPLSDRRVQLYAAKGTDIRPAIFQFSVAQNLVLLELHQEASSVEEVFQQLTRAKKEVQ
ncbi:MAG: gliding motility-associated ABC transporter ATP-binding subunit GldA [Haliscomenobacter sp.]